MKKVAVLLADGFEGGQAIVTIDIFRRLELNVELLSCTETREVTSYHNIPMVADSTLSERLNTRYNAVVLPGGPLGSINLSINPQVISFLTTHDKAGELI